MVSEPQPDSFAVALYDRANQFEDQYNKFGNQIGILRGTRRISQSSLQSMNSMLSQIEHLYFNNVMSALNQYYPFIENTDSQMYK